MNDFSLTARIPDAEQPKNYLGQFSKAFSSAIGHLQGKRKVVQFTGTMKGTEFFSQAMIVQKAPKNQAKLEKFLQDRRLIPIILKPVNSVEEAEALAPRDVVFVAIDELSRLSLNQQSTRKIEGSLSTILSNPESSPALKLRQVHMALESTFEINSFFLHLHSTFREKCSQPIENEVLMQAEAVVRERPKGKLTDEQLDKLVGERTGGSHTIEVDPEKRQDWLDAEAFIRQKAETGEDLSLEDLCKINAVLLGKECEEIGGGFLRDHQVTCGGIEGPNYVHHEDVPKLMMELFEEMKEGFEKEKNPIVLAATTYQKMVSIHPFTDANGRTCRLAMDYILIRAGLPPAALGKDVTVAIFGDQDCEDKPPLSTPTEAVQKVITGVQKSYEMI